MHQLHIIIHYTYCILCYYSEICTLCLQCQPNLTVFGLLVIVRQNTYMEQMSYWKLPGINYSTFYLVSLSLTSVFKLLSLPRQISRSLQNYKIPLVLALSIAKTSLTSIKEERKITWKLRSGTLMCCTAAFQNIAALLPVDTDQPVEQWGLWCYIPSFLA